MTNHEHSHKLAIKIIAMRKILFVLSGFAVPHFYIIGASHFVRSFKNHSYGYACSNDELLSKVVFERFIQAATWSTSVTSIPSLNLIPVITLAR